MFCVVGRMARDDPVVAGLATILLGICLLHNESNSHSQAWIPLPLSTRRARQGMIRHEYRKFTLAPSPPRA